MMHPMLSPEMTEPTHLLSVHTLDKRGIVAGISGALEAAGARLLELSQTVVRDYFTIVVIVALPEDCDEQALIAAVRAELAPGAAVNLLPYRAGRPVLTDGERYVLTAVGPDRPGVVPVLSALIAERGGNFTDLDGRVVGDRIRLVAELVLPRSTALDQLLIDLEHAGAEIGLQMRLQHSRLFQATNELPFRRLAP